MAVKKKKRERRLEGLERETVCVCHFFNFIFVPLLCFALLLLCNDEVNVSASFHKTI